MLDIVGRNPTMRAIGLKFFSGDTLVETADDGLDRARAGPRTLRVHLPTTSTSGVKGILQVRLLGAWTAGPLIRARFL